VGESPAEVRKNVGRHWKWLEVVGRLVKAREGCGSPNMASGSKPHWSEEHGSLRKMAEAKLGVQNGSEECWERLGLLWKRRLSLEEAKRLAEDQAWVQKDAEGCRSAMEVQATSQKWSEDCGRESECKEECGKELG